MPLAFEEWTTWPDCNASKKQVKAHGPSPTNLWTQTTKGLSQMIRERKAGPTTNGRPNSIDRAPSSTGATALPKSTKKGLAS